MKPNQKLYLVSRKDLRPGAQAVQAAHAMRQFAANHPALEREWFEKSNHLCFLTVANEAELIELMHIAINRHIQWAVFQEPDLNMQYTAIALEPSDEVSEMLRSLPLGLSEYNAVQIAPGPSSPKPQPDDRPPVKANRIDPYGIDQQD